MTNANLFAPPKAVPRSEPAALPWKLSAQFWLAFFAGPVATGLVVYVNLRRFGARSASPYRIILGTTLTACFVYVSLAVALAASPMDDALPRLFLSIVCCFVSLIHCGFLQWLQSPFDERWRSQGKPYGSMVAFGMFAWFVGRLALSLTFVVACLALGV